jgi:hypothetical protein
MLRAQMSFGQIYLNNACHHMPSACAERAKAVTIPALTSIRYMPVLAFAALLLLFWPPRQKAGGS